MESEKEIYGIDVSHWNGDIDWGQAAGSGIRFAMLKCLIEGSGRFDSKFKQNYNGCIEHKIHVGVYNYVIAKNCEEAEEEADALISALKGKKITYGVWLDIEDRRLLDIPAADLISITDTMVDKLEKAGYVAGVYCKKNWYDQLFAPHKTSYRFWIARCPVKDDGQVHPRLDPGVGLCWQYSSKGTVKGITGKVDLDLARTDISHIRVRPS